MEIPSTRDQVKIYSSTKFKWVKEKGKGKNKERIKVSASIYSKVNNWENENLIWTQLPAHVTITFPPSCGGARKDQWACICMQSWWFEGSCWRHHILDIMTDIEEACVKTRGCEQPKVLSFLFTKSCDSIICQPSLLAQALTKVHHAHHAQQCTRKNKRSYIYKACSMYYYASVVLKVLYLSIHHHHNMRVMF